MHRTVSSPSKPYRCGYSFLNGHYLIKLCCLFCTSSLLARNWRSALFWHVCGKILFGMSATEFSLAARVQRILFSGTSEVSLGNQNESLTKVNRYIGRSQKNALSCHKHTIPLWLFLYKFSLPKHDVFCLDASLERCSFLSRAKCLLFWHERSEGSPTARARLTMGSLYMSKPLAIGQTSAIS